MQHRGASLLVYDPRPKSGGVGALATQGRAHMTGTEPRAPIAWRELIRAHWGALAIVSCFVFVSWLPRLNGPMDLRSDSAVYYILGTSLAEGKGYRLLNEPGDIRAVQYPPGLPLVAAAHQRLLGTSDYIVVTPWLRVTCFVFFWAFMLASYAVLRRYLSTTFALIGTVICMFHVEIFVISELFYPEVLYGLLTTAAFLIARRSTSRVNEAVSAVLAVLAFAVRSVGLAFFVAWVGESVLQRQFKRAVVRAAIALVPVLAWQGYVGAVARSAEYTQPAYEYQRANYLFYNVSYAANILTYADPMAPERGRASVGDLASRVLWNLTAVPSKFGEAVSSIRESYELPWKVFSFPRPFSTPWPVGVCLVILGGFTLLGIFKFLLKGEWFVVLYLAVSVAIMCATPWPEQFVRYLMPVAPFLFACFLSALVTTTRLQGRIGTGGRALCVAILSLVLLQQALWMVILHRSRKTTTVSNSRGDSLVYRDYFLLPAYRAFNTATDWLRANAQPGDVAAGSMPHNIYLRTGLKSVMSPFEPDPARAQGLLDSVPVTYLLVDQGLALDLNHYMEPVVTTFPDKWQRVFSVPVVPEPGHERGGDFIIYRRVSAPLVSADTVRGTTGR